MSTQAASKSRILTVRKLPCFLVILPLPFLKIILVKKFVFVVVRTFKRRSSLSIFSSL